MACEDGMRSHLFFLFPLGWAAAFRIPLDFDTPGPFLQSSVTGAQGGPYTSKLVVAPFSWSSVYLGKLLHMSEAIEIGPRGVLFFMRPKQTQAFTTTTSPCAPTPHGLCRMSEGLVLPSAWYPGAFPVGMMRRTGDPVLSVFSRNAHDACGMEGRGEGRIFSEAAEYTVTACDVVQGTHGLIYHTATGGVEVYEQTFGPIAYLIVLISATIHIFALGQTCYSPGPQSWILRYNSHLAILTCILLYFRGILHFHLVTDEVFFWATALWAWAFLAFFSGPEGYVLSLSTLATTLYRTHETPYAAIIAYILGYRTFRKALAACHGQPMLSIPAYIDLIASVLHVTVFCELGVKPQCLYTEIWPIYYMFHAFICYHVVKYQDCH